MLEARAINRYVNSSPRKMRLVIDLIRGKSVAAALSILHFQPKHASRVAEKVLRSAVANLHQKDVGSRSENEDLIVKTVFVDGGASMKRILPAPMGRAFRMVKRSNHLTIIVAKTPEIAPKSATKRGAKPVAASKVKTLSKKVKE